MKKLALQEIDFKQSLPDLIFKSSLTENKI
ncbi:hypothetical protein EDF67_1011094 [Sphingobacterium sp. JUb78]|nr:hypothetical protein [Sphingobacterium kitahiroshimense]TCR14987.1 hypothetical protein EDF67_1011094 [Sphingobacterium sp. JUb78]